MKNIALFLTLTTTIHAAGAPSASVSTPPPALTGQWSKQQITESFWAEGACVADVNKDGKNDILSGPFWYEGPDFKKAHEIYKMEKAFDRKKEDGTVEKVPGFKGFLGGVKEYSNNFVSYTYDFNGDGWMDYLVVGFPGAETFWWENPQGKDELWQRHTAVKVTDNESPMFVDVNGDKIPDLLCMSGGTIGYATMDPKNPNEVWKWNPVSGKDGRFQKYTHGIGAGDVNGDGRTDILEAGAWWEQPANWDGVAPWTKHDAQFGSGGAQMYTYDVNGDGKADIITALAAHGLGLAWFEQTNDGLAQGWSKHLITGTKPGEGETGVIFSQPHAIDLVDMNGDGIKDIVTGKRFWAHGPGGDPDPNAWAVLYWFELKRAGSKASYTAHIIDDNSGVGTQVMATDVNGDGKPDIVAANKRGVFVHTRNFTPNESTAQNKPQTEPPLPRKSIVQAEPKLSGSGFFITEDGYLITNRHVAEEGATVRIVTANGAIAARVVKADKPNDLSLLKVDGSFHALPVASSRPVRLGATVATIGFPNVGLQGFLPKLAKGEIASLAGVQDDSRQFQISVPVQPGNSGGALVDDRGNVIGVVVAKLNQKAALATTGTLAENVNYAVKSSYLLSFLESIPEVSTKLKEPTTKDRKFEEVVNDVQQAAVLVLVY